MTNARGSMSTEQKFWHVAFCAECRLGAVPFGERWQLDSWVDGHVTVNPDHAVWAIHLHDGQAGSLSHIADQMRDALERVMRAHGWGGPAEEGEDPLDYGPLDFFHDTPDTEWKRFEDPRP